ncbi:MAG: GtrA family protein [Rhizobiaceae bacterium]
MPRATDHVSSDAVRFLVAGGLNTALTTLVYFVALLVASPGVSYTIAWLVGLAFVMIFYPDRVFVGGDNSLKARLMLGAVTIGVFLIGLALLQAFIRFTGDARIAFLLTLAATTTINFVAGRMLLRR